MPEDNFWDALAARCWVGREFVRRTYYLMGYGGEVDPWVRHVLLTEARSIHEETTRC